MSDGLFPDVAVRIMYHKVDIRYFICFCANINFQLSVICLISVDLIQNGVYIV